MRPVAAAEAETMLDMYAAGRGVHVISVEFDRGTATVRRILDAARSAGDRRADERSRQGRAVRLSTAQIAILKEMDAREATAREMARVVGCHADTICRRLREIGIEPRKHKIQVAPQECIAPAQMNPNIVIRKMHRFAFADTTACPLWDCISLPRITLIDGAAA